MKLQFQILKARPKIKIILTRDSVAAGDDCDAPHKKILTIHSFLDPHIFVREISSNYLPSVAGIGHSWLCVFNEIQIAEIKNSEIKILIQETPFSEENHAHFVYKSASF